MYHKCWRGWRHPKDECSHDTSFRWQRSPWSRILFISPSSSCQAAVGCFSVMGQFRSDPVVSKHQDQQVLPKNLPSQKFSCHLHTDTQRILPLKKRQSDKSRPLSRDDNEPMLLIWEITYLRFKFSPSQLWSY